MNKKVVIVDYQLGNLFSVQQACRHCGTDALVSSDNKLISSADAIILPGVGAFPQAMQNIQKLELFDTLIEFAKSGRPLMGICLGLQLLFSTSDEFGITGGLNIIEGTVKKLSSTNTQDKIKVPHISWNKVRQSANNWESTPLSGLADGVYQYFVHSFYVEPINSDLILSTTDYQGLTYCSSIMKDNIFACQFHPEKSGKNGLKVYSNWLRS